jgi:CheY-like chemotaxis protein
MVAKTMLENLRCAVDIATNGREAVQAYCDNEPAIILMDISMPEMDGIEATARLREIQAQTGRRTPIIGVTAHAMKEDRQRCIDAGMDDYLAKPIKPGPLADLLKTWCVDKPSRRRA